MSDRVKAVERYKEKVGEEYPILGWVEGAFAEAADLRGLNDLMMDMFDEPEAVKDLLDVCTQQAIWFAEEQIKAGADFIGIGDAAASLIGPLGYAEFALPYEKRIVDAVHKAGAKAKLHICGNITSILDVISYSGADMIDVDFMVDFAAANSAFSGCSACGNFSPIEVLLQGSPDTVKEAVKSCVKQGNERTFIAAGCEVPVSTPLENMSAVHEALLDIAQEQ
jgi:MtaA/CmuA family methyltransferase